MAEMVERVKLALRAFEAGVLLETGSVNPSGDNYEITKARAAIEAMREPTSKMLVAANEIAHKEYDGSLTEPRPLDLWRTMIDVALAEDGPPNQRNDDENDQHDRQQP